MEIFSAGVPIGSSKADLFRADLASNEIGDGRHGFKFPLPPGDFPEETIAVKVERSAFWLIDSGGRRAASFDEFDCARSAVAAASLIDARR